MPDYSDKRNRYAGRSPIDFQPGQPHGDNPVPTPEAKTDLAKRGPTPGEHFRVTTSTVAPPESQPTQVDSAASKPVSDAKVSEVAKGAPESLPAPASIGSVLSRDDVQGSKG